MSETQTLELMPIHESLTDEQMGNLLAAVGNHEGKAYTALLLGDIPMGMTDLHQAFVRGQGSEIAHRGGVSVQFAYCDNTLEKVGLVARHHFSGEGIKFTKTEFGKEVGDAAIGLLLDFSLRHPGIRLKDIFGATQNPGKMRSAEARLRLFRAISDKGSEAQLNEIVAASGVEATVAGKTLGKLSLTGLIEYESQAPDEHRDEFKINKEKIVRDSLWPRSGTMSDMLLTAVERAAQNGQNFITTKDIREEIRGRGADVGKTSRQFKQGVIAARLKLEEKGVLSPVTARQTDSVFSALELTEEQRGFIVELVEILDGIQSLDQDTLQLGRELAADILSSPDKVRTLLKKHYSASRYVNNLPDNAISSILRQLFERLPEQELTGEDVSQLLERAGYPGVSAHEATHKLLDISKTDTSLRARQDTKRYWFSSSHR